MTDAWYPEVARLRAAWRVNAAEDRERLALEALLLIEQVLILAPTENLFRLRAMSSQTLGDDNRLLESSRYLATTIDATLNASASQGYTFSPEELEQIRRNLTVIVNQIDNDLDIPEPERLADVLDGVNTPHPVR